MRLVILLAALTSWNLNLSTALAADTPSTQPSGSPAIAIAEPTIKKGDPCDLRNYSSVAANGLCCSEGHVVIAANGGGCESELQFKVEAVNGCNPTLIAPKGSKEEKDNDSACSKARNAWKKALAGEEQQNKIKARERKDQQHALGLLNNGTNPPEKKGFAQTAEDDAKKLLNWGPNSATSYGFGAAMGIGIGAAALAAGVVTTGGALGVALVVGLGIGYLLNSFSK